MIQVFFVAITLLVLTSLISCKQSSTSEFKVIHPSWVDNATVYEVNIRQFTHEGTLKAFETHLPRLKELGVEIIWFMPIHPIGELNRKGPLGSYYSVKDYLAVSPEFGTIDDFKRIVSKAHEFGMKVIIDWVANHTSHDAILIKEHPDWYVYDSKGTVVSPFDWSDVAKLDYNKKGLREYIINAMKFWVKDVGVDGFRCDVAAEVPVSFWNEARKELDIIKPVFMLAEAETPEMQKYAFDADYAWKFHKIMNNIAKGKESVNSIEKYLLNSIATYPKNTIKFNFITNHDENSWNGTEFERLGDGVKTFAALSFVMPGLPLIYSGQEVGLNKRLKFFEKDDISWNDSLGLTPFYKKLVELKKTNSVLAVGDKGADILRIKSSNDSCVFSFLRKNESEKLFSIFNLSDKDIKVTFEGDEYVDLFNDYMSGETKTFVKGEEVTLKPWEFHIYIKK
ncbi:MAG: alpha-amylase [Bacteroidales bacterium]|nr:alpha-amylase [Bacteroidales bacterium]